MDIGQLKAYLSANRNSGNPAVYRIVPSDCLRARIVAMEASEVSRYS